MGGPIIAALLVAGTAAMPAVGMTADAGAQGLASPPAAVECLAQAIGYEAGNESVAGQEAVAQVILNRLSSPAYPKTICGVVYQGSARRTGCQFSFTCDRSLARGLPARIVAGSHEVAVRALSGRLVTAIGDATHYHAYYVSPRWAPSLVKVATIGAHIFYRMPGLDRAPGRYVAAVAEMQNRGSQAPAPAAAVPAPRAGTFTVWGLAVGVPAAGSN